MKKISIYLITLLFLSLTYCTKDDNSDDPNSDPDETEPAKTFLGVTFTPTYAYFSTQGDSSGTMSAYQAQSAASSIDITYIYDGDYNEAGFLDAVTRSSDQYYWSSTYRTPWSSVSQKTIWYYCSLESRIELFNNAMSDQSKIGEIFSDTTHLKIIQHPVWPEGSSAGGRSADQKLGAFKVFGFKRVSDGKRGLIYIDRVPTNFNENCIVNIVIEN